MNAVVSVVMTLHEAQEWDAEVGRAGNYLRLLLQDGYQRGAWRVLGYDNWTACLSALAEKHGFTERRLWQLHQANEIQARVTEKISVDRMIPDSHLRPLTRLEPADQVAAWQMAVETAPNGKVTAAHVEEVVRQRQEPSHRLINQSNSNEWYTPETYVNAARAVMGGVDLDPASNEYANRVIKAGAFYTRQDDGLSRAWFGRIWLNPPYGREEAQTESNQAVWSRRLIDEYDAGNVFQAVLLVNAVPGNRWFAPLWRFPICFPDHRIRFYNEDTAAGQPTHSNALVYLGENVSGFVTVFSAIGPVVGELTRYGNLQ